AMPVDAAARAEDAHATSPQPEVAVSDMPAAPAGWWDAHWKKRARVTVSDPELKEELSDFQVPVKLEPGSFEYAAAKADGSDLRFLAADGTGLDHEIDAWNPGGASLLWLRLPKVGAAPVVVSLYYGNPDPPAPV